MTLVDYKKLQYCKNKRNAGAATWKNKQKNDYLKVYDYIKKVRKKI